MAKPFLANLRRRVADFILGGQTVLFVNAKEKELMDAHEYMALDDETLGKVFRRWWGIQAKVVKERADRDGDNRAWRDILLSASILFIAGFAQKVNAATANFVQTGSIDSGRTVKKWRVRFEQLPDDYDDGIEEGVHVTRDPDDPNKITEMTYSVSNPGFDAWREEQSRASDAR